MSGTEQTVAVEVEPDFVERQARATPVQALAEFIWNALDADATRVHVLFDRSELRLEGITVRDNGVSVPREDAPRIFGHLGGSWKRTRNTTLEKGRAVHGKEGRGRYKAVALGNFAEWCATYQEGGSGDLLRYSVIMRADELRQVTISDPERADDGRRGMVVSITNLRDGLRNLQSDSAKDDITELFAPYLMNYTDVGIYYDGDLLDRTTAVKNDTEVPLRNIQVGQEVFPASLHIVEWSKAPKRALFFCNEKGFPLFQADTRFHVGREHLFSAYLKSSYIQRLYDQNALQLAEMDVDLAKTLEEARTTLKDHFRRRSAETARSVVDEWKAEETYPYKGEPASSVEEVERQVFDIIAVTAAQQVPDFGESTKKARAFQLRMLRQAVERSPDDLQTILREVLDLPVRQQEDLARLLRETSLSKIISAARVVSDRLKFLAGLEEIVFDVDLKKHLKERSQLHRMIADNTWLFGEEFHLMVDDRSLTEGLRQHLALLGSDAVVDAPVKHPTKERGIVDLILSRARRTNRANELEHLVVELKAPKVSIKQKEIGQLEGYAQAVAGDDRFDRANTRWTFWALSNAVDEGYLDIRQVENAPAGVIVKRKNITMAVRTWSQIINDNRARLHFFQDQLQHHVDKREALSYLRERYDAIISSTITDDVIKREQEEEDAAGAERGSSGDYEGGASPP